MKTLAVSLLFFCSSVFAESYVIDKSHTKILFHITHLVFNTMTGKFTNFSGSFDYNQKKGILKNVDVVIKAKSIDTEHTKRDKHLRSEDFFYAKKHPEITFKLKKKRIKVGRRRTINGELTMRGVTKEVPLKLILNGPIKDPWGNKVLVFNLQGKINRKDFEIDWNKGLTGKIKGKLIGEVAEIEIQGEANPKK